jgi:hypothetical protein
MNFKCLENAIFSVEDKSNFVLIVLSKDSSSVKATRYVCCVCILNSRVLH